MCMFSLGDFLSLFIFFFAGGGRGMWVAVKLDSFFFWGGGGGEEVMFDVWSTLRLRLRLGIVCIFSGGGGGVYSYLNIFGACFINIS